MIISVAGMICNNYLLQITVYFLTSCKNNMWLNSCLSTLEAELHATIFLCGWTKPRWSLCNVSFISGKEIFLSHTTDIHNTFLPFKKNREKIRTLGEYYMLLVDDKLLTDFYSYFGAFLFALLMLLLSCSISFFLLFCFGLWWFSKFEIMHIW